MSFSSLRILATVATLLGACLVSVAAPVPPTPPAPKVADDYQFLPATTNVLMVYRLDQLFASDGFKVLRKEFPDMVEKELETSFRKSFGFDITNVEWMTYGGNVKEGPVAIIHLKNAVAVETIKKARSEPRFEGDMGTAFKEEKIGSAILYVPDGREEETYRQAFCMVKDKLLLIARAQELRAALDPKKKAELSSALQVGLKAADLAATMTLVMDVKSVAAAEKLPAVPGVDVNLLANAIDTAVLTAKVGKEVSLRGVAICKTAKDAEDVKKQFEIIRTLVTTALKGAPIPLPQGILELPDKVKVTIRDNVGEATLTIQNDLILSLIKSTMPPK